MNFLPVSLSCQIPGLNEIYAQYFNEPGVFVEVGGNDGYSWSNTWHLAEGGWRGIYFEPVKDLAEKCAARHARNNVTVIQCAVGSIDGETKLYLGEGCTTSEYVARNNTFLYGNSIDRYIMTPVCTLNVVLNELGLPRDFDLLVVDVDGDEVGVLQGLKLGSWLPKMIIIETSKDSQNKGWNFNAAGIEIRLKYHYTEIYHDHINSIYVRKGNGMTSLFESKWKTILDYAGQFGCVNFVETGTGGGDTLDCVYPYFEKCCSIELGGDLFRGAQKRFANAPTIQLLQGDSARVLSGLPPLKGPTLYFLDAHYSGPGTAMGPHETPIMIELAALLDKAKKFNGVILIDDLKDFVSNIQYPKLEVLRDYVESLRPGLVYEVVNQGGGMILIASPKLKREPGRKLRAITPRAVAVIFQPVQVPGETKKEERNFERPPILYGPYR